MIVIMRDAIMPDCCNTCVCSEGYGCGITGTIMTTKEMESRPDWCPLEEVEPCEDAVSRNKMFDTAAEYENELREILGDENELVEVVKILKHRLIALPSVQQKPLKYSGESICVFCRTPNCDGCLYEPMEGVE